MTSSLQLALLLSNALGHGVPSGPFIVVGFAAIFVGMAWYLLVQTSFGRWWLGVRQHPETGWQRFKWFWVTTLLWALVLGGLALIAIGIIGLFL
jgi:hypothetical protein